MVLHQATGALIDFPNLAEIAQRVRSPSPREVTAAGDASRRAVN